MFLSRNIEGLERPLSILITLGVEYHWLPWFLSATLVFSGIDSYSADSSQAGVVVVKVPGRLWAGVLSPGFVRPQGWTLTSVPLNPYPARTLACWPRGGTIGNLKAGQGQVATLRKP